MVLLKIFELPVEIYTYIFDRFDICDIVAAKLVCKSWNDVINTHLPITGYIWNNKCWKLYKDNGTYIRNVVEFNNSIVDKITCHTGYIGHKHSFEIIDRRIKCITLRGIDLCTLGSVYTIISCDIPISSNITIDFSRSLITCGDDDKYPFMLYTDNFYYTYQRITNIVLPVEFI